jgi:putative two-component system response regulator
VDDEPYVRKLIARWLQGDGYTVVEADGPEAARSKLQREEYDLVTLDITMPGELGTEILQDVSNKFPDTAVIMITGVGKTKLAIESLNRGAWAYLSKPVERDELRFHVRNALERRFLRLEARDYTSLLETRVQAQTREIETVHREIILRLMAAAHGRDGETGAHVRRTGLYSRILAKSLGWSESDLDRIALAATMHDIGKIAIPDAILHKQGRLTREEFDIMKKHTVLGARMLAGSEVPVIKMAHDIALYHHEMWNGQGYPLGLSGEAIPESARIVAVIDVYDALSHDRPYRPKFAEDDVIDMMQRGMSVQFDPCILPCFFAALTEMHDLAESIPDEVWQEQHGLPMDELLMGLELAVEERCC